ncbi:MAG: transcriptional regulator [Magnetococcales bacterium]|nr:transcriptional regulator [Magnetococcales bacterium]
MSEIADSILRGAEDALAYAQGNDNRGQAHVPQEVDVKAIRLHLKMSQRIFAKTFGFSVHTLRHWEHGIRKPKGAARAFLTVIQRDPNAVVRALIGSTHFPGSDAVTD